MMEAVGVPTIPMMRPEISLSATMVDALAELLRVRKYW